MDEEPRRSSFASDDGLGRLEEELLIARLKAESHRCQAENDELRAELKTSRAQHAEALRTAAAEWVRHRTYRSSRLGRRLGPRPSPRPALLLLFPSPLIRAPSTIRSTLSTTSRNTPPSLHPISVLYKLPPPGIRTLSKPH